METRKRDIARFILLSILGIFLYFIPVKGSIVPVVLLVNTIKKGLGGGISYLVIAALLLLALIIAGAQIFKNERCIHYLGGDKISRQIHYLIAFALVLAIQFKLPPARIFSNPDIGGQILGL